MKNLLKVVPMVLFLISCGGKIETSADMPEGTGPRGNENIPTGENGTSVETPASTECKKDYLGKLFSECRTQLTAGKWSIVTKDSENNPVLKHEDNDFIMTALTDKLLNGDEHKKTCSDLKVEAFYQTKYTKFRVVNNSQFNTLNGQNILDVFDNIPAKILVKDTDSDGWNRIIYTSNGEEYGTSHPSHYKYQSFCVAFENVEFANGRIHLATRMTWEPEAYLTANKVALTEKMQKNEINIAKDRCNGDVDKVKEGKIELSYQEDPYNTGYMRFYGSSDSTFKCR